MAGADQELAYDEEDTAPRVISLRPMIRVPLYGFIESSRRV